MGMKSGKCAAGSTSSRPSRRRETHVQRLRRSGGDSLRAPSVHRTRARRSCCSDTSERCVEDANPQGTMRCRAPLPGAEQPEKAALFRPIAPLFPDRRRPREVRVEDLGQTSDASFATGRRSSSRAIAAHALPLHSLRCAFARGLRRTALRPMSAAPPPSDTSASCRLLPRRAVRSVRCQQPS